MQTVPHQPIPSAAPAAADRQRVQRVLCAYAVAVAGPVAMVGVHYWHGFTSGPAAGLILFLPPIILAAYGGGLGPGVVATGLSSALSAWYLLLPTHSFLIASAFDQVQWVLLLGTGLMVSLLSEALRRGRARAEAREARFAVTLVSIGDAVIVTDPAGRVSFMNAAAEHLTGWPLADALGQPLAAVFVIINEATRQPVEDPVAKVRRLGTVVGLANHTLLVARDGHTTPIDDSGAPIRAGQGTMQGVVLVFRDCTQTRAAEAALLAEVALRERVAQLVATVPGAFTSMRRSAAGEMSLLYASPALVDLYGVTPEEAYAQRGRLGERVHPADRPRLARELAESGAALTPWHSEYRVQHPTRGERWIAAHARPAAAADGSVIWHGFLADVTDRRQQELALRASEQRYRLLAENISDVIWVMDLDRRHFTYLSPSVTQLCGYTAEEVTAGELTAILTPAALAHLTQVLPARLAAIHHGADQRYVDKLEHRRRDGSTVWTEVISRFQHNPATGHVELFGSTRDIHERHLAEQALAQERTLLRTLVDALPDLIFIKDLNGNFVLSNWAHQALRGVASEAALVGKNVFDFYPPAMARAFHRDDQRVLQEGQPILGREEQITDTQGRSRWYTTIKAPIRDPGGAIVGLVGMSRDIQASKDTQLKLQRSEMIHRAIARSIPDGVVLVVDPALRCLVAEGSLAASLGLPAQLEGRTLTETMTDDALRTSLNGGLENALAGRSASHEMELHERTVWSLYAPLRDEQGQVLAAMLLALDITTRKAGERERLELERHLLHAQKLESLGVLAGGIAHDFNNLLMVVLGNLDLALLDLPADAPARTSVDLAIKASHRAADLTRQMLAYSGKGQFIIRRLDLGALVHENVALFRAAIARTVTLTLKLGADPVTIAADPGQIEQIIMNLITNAAEAIGEQPGELALTVHECVADDELLAGSRLTEKPAPGRFACLTVRDTGCGMTPATCQRLFEPFFTTKFTGRGLGMAAVLGIVRGHHGAILINSAFGQGTTIRVLFPICVSAEPAMITAPPPAPDTPPDPSPTVTITQPQLVLVVDDEEALRSFGLAVVKLLGYTGIAAADGEDALALFRLHGPNIACVLLDLTMPRMDGVTTFRELRRLRADVRVVLTSGFSEQEACQRFTEEGLAGFIQKPYRLDELRRQLLQVIGVAGS